MLLKTDDPACPHFPSWQLLINIMLGLMVPACGYFGAKNRNRSLLSCFYGWSMAQACCGGITVFFLFTILSNGGKIRVHDRGTDGYGGAGYSDHEQNYHEEEVPMGVVVVALVTAIVQVVLNIAQFWYGKQLLDSDYFSPEYALQPVEPNTSVVQAQEAPAGPPGYAVAQPFTGQVPSSVPVGQPAVGSVVVPHVAQPYGGAMAADLEGGSAAPPEYKERA